jgi:hypothetical protein
LVFATIEAVWRYKFMQKLFFMLAILNLLLKIACFQPGDWLADVGKYERTGVY